MSRFKLSCDYFMRSINWPHNLKLLREKCLAKYPRGVNLIYVTKEQKETTFTPHFLIDPGRIFLTYDRLINEAFDPKPDEDSDFFKTLKNAIQIYDPATTLLFLFASEDGELQFYDIHV